MLLAVTPSASAQAAQDIHIGEELIAAATRTAKPIVVFHRPADCAGARGADRCERFAKTALHPSIGRRLRHMVFTTTIFDDRDIPHITVHDPGGRLVHRWHGIPDGARLADILNRVIDATPHLLEMHARAPADSQRSELEMALALITLGDRDRGIELLESIREDAPAETSQLAEVHLHVLASEATGLDGSLRRLEYLAREGASDAVRYETLMAIGEMLLGEEPAGAAVSFERALRFARRPAETSRAEEALRRSRNLPSAIAGLEDPDGIVFGRHAIAPEQPHPQTARVEYSLDGKLVGTATSPPFTASVDFGEVPDRHVLEIVSSNRKGDVIQRDVVVVNDRNDSPWIRIVSPVETTLSGPVDVDVMVRAGAGQEIERVTVEWNGRPVARFDSPPFRTTLTIPQGEQGYLRAELRLTDGTITEDVRIVNYADRPLQAGRHLVEVPAYLERTDPSAITLRENGETRPVNRIVPSHDSPLLIALLLDASASMNEHILDVQEAALQFVEKNLDSRDRVMVVPFRSSSRVLWPVSDRGRIERTILSLSSGGATVLHDAMIGALLAVRSTGSRRALVVLSDGIDNGSVFGLDVVEEVARRSGAPVYVLAFSDSGERARSSESGSMTQQKLLDFSRATGAKSFRLNSLDNLPEILEQIADDLRKQALVVYSPNPALPSWRAIEITEQGRPVRAPSGIYVTPESD